MRTVLVASVRTHARRYVAALLAVLAGVSFVLVTASISSAAKGGLLSDLRAAYPGAQVVVGGLDVADTDRALTRLVDVGPTTVDAEARVPVAVDGSRLGQDVSVRSVSTAASLRWQRLSEGRFPTRRGQALVDADQARRDDVRLGDRVQVGQDGGLATVRVVGLTRAGPTSQSAEVYLTWPDMVRLGDSTLVDQLVVGGDATVAQVRALTPRAQVSSASDFLQAEAREVTRGVDAVSALLLGFAAIALFVSVLVIANTFTVLLAQRQRDFALLRCVGATRRQVRRSVRQEALVIGVGASTVAVGLGLLLGRLVVAGLHALVPAVPSGAVQVGWRWIVAAWLIGVLVTLVASVLPARRSTRVEPLAALRPLGAVDARTRSGAGRIGLGLLLVAVGTGLLVLSTTEHSLLLMLAGGFASFTGLLLLGPLVVPACIRVVGLLAGRTLGVPGRLATANAVRNPRRTAATAASLLVGTTLVSGLVVGVATLRDSVDTAMDTDHPLDAVVSSARPLPSATVDRVRSVDGVARTSALLGTTARASAPAADPGTGARTGERTALGDQPVLAARAAARGVAHGATAFADPGPRTAYVPFALTNQMTDQRTITLTEAGRSVELRVVPTSGVDAVYVAPATLERLDPGATTRAVWVRAADGADADALATSLGAVARSSGADLSESVRDRAYADLQLDVMVYAVVGLLSIALAIALLGIANTLGLSVLERGREHGVLRALGLTRGQLRATLAVEAVLLAVVTSAIGVVVGTAYAAAGVTAVIAPAVAATGVQLAVPVAQLLLVLVLALVAGLAACVLPARRAVRTAPAAGLALD